MSTIKSYGDVYLAGPMTGFSREKQLEWRIIYNKVCENMGINTYSPQRSREFLPAKMYHNSDNFTARDVYDVKRCNVIVANVRGAERVSIGTIIEIGMAHAMNKPVVLIREPGNVHQATMLDAVVPFVVENLHDSLLLVASLLLSDTKIREAETDMEYWLQLAGYNGNE